MFVNLFLGFVCETILHKKHLGKAGEWNRRWRVEDGGRRVEGGRWKGEGGRWKGGGKREEGRGWRVECINHFIFPVHMIWKGAGTSGGSGGGQGRLG